MLLLYVYYCYYTNSENILKTLEHQFLKRIINLLMFVYYLLIEINNFKYNTVTQVVQLLFHVWRHLLQLLMLKLLILMWEMKKLENLRTLLIFFLLGIIKTNNNQHLQFIRMTILTLLKKKEIKPNMNFHLMCY